MANNEGDEPMACSDCGNSLYRSDDRLYAFGTDGVLCMECALIRGGAWDESKERWTVPPRVEDLLTGYEPARL